ncbi:MAG: hypothetical protein Tsb0014_26440 [Pleurocapsa sp.]
MINAITNQADFIESKLIDQLVYLKKREFSGTIEIKSSAQFSWTFYFYLGRLIGCDGGHHGNRCLKRYLLKYCKFSDLKQAEAKIKQNYVNSIECQSYNLLVSLCKINLLQREQAIDIIKKQVQDVLFDILQQENFGTMHYNVEAELDSSKFQFNLHDALTLVNIEYLLKQSYQDWVNWINAGFEFWSPNFAPVIRKKETLEKMVSLNVYQNFTNFINGRRTLRELANTMNKNLLLLIRSLAPYIRQGIIGLIEVPDIVFPNYLSIPKPVKLTEQSSKNQPLIVCIDDSNQIRQTMKNILCPANYNYLEISEAIQAIPTLINQKPDLIFLDIGMPIMNGYEICTQIKRVSKLQNIPVVILTGKDGIFDRMRAKMVGASAFLNKPIDSEKVLKLVENLTKEQLQANEPGLIANIDPNINYNLSYI